MLRQVAELLCAGVLHTHKLSSNTLSNKRATPVCIDLAVAASLSLGSMHSTSMSEVSWHIQHCRRSKAELYLVGCNSQVGTVQLARQAQLGGAAVHGLPSELWRRQRRCGGGLHVGAPHLHTAAGVSYS